MIAFERIFELYEKDLDSARIHLFEKRLDIIRIYLRRYWMSIKISDDIMSDVYLHIDTCIRNRNYPKEKQNCNTFMGLISEAFKTHFKYNFSYICNVPTSNKWIFPTIEIKSCNIEEAVESIDTQYEENIDNMEYVFTLEFIKNNYHILNDNERKTIQMMYIWENKLNTMQVAKVLNTTYRTVLSYHRRALKKLHNKFNAYNSYSITRELQNSKNKAEQVRDIIDLPKKIWWSDWGWKEGTDSLKESSSYDPNIMYEENPISI